MNSATWRIPKREVTDLLATQNVGHGPAALTSTQNLLESRSSLSTPVLLINLTVCLGGLHSAKLCSQGFMVCLCSNWTGVEHQLASMGHLGFWYCWCLVPGRGQVGVSLGLWTEIFNELSRGWESQCQRKRSHTCRGHTKARNPVKL